MILIKYIKNPKPIDGVDYFSGIEPEAKAETVDNPKTIEVETAEETVNSKAKNVNH